MPLNEMDNRTIDLSSNGPKNFHIVGIGGAGMSAIAHVLKRMGKNVSGSDLKQSNVTDRLQSQNIKVSIPRPEPLIDNSVEIVLCSSAVPKDDPEVIEAKEKAIPVLTRADILSSICATQKSIGIAGSHGKTTTTSMTTQIARTAEMNPSFMIGGDVNEIGTNAAYRKDSILVVEADESDQTFLRLPLKGAIVTNIENDHLENYEGKFENLLDSFFKFVNNVQGPVVICVDEINARKLAQSATNPNLITVGSQDADWTYDIISTARNGISAVFRNSNLGIEQNIELAVPGIHNVQNAICAFAMMISLGVEPEICAKGLSAFGGVARRFQFRGETKGITFVDDYGHLPTEIRATLKTALSGGFSRVIAVFQPHRFSRTKALYKEFAEALADADFVIVCEIYSAGEEPLNGVTSALIFDYLAKELKHTNVYYPKHIQDMINLIEGIAQTGDLVLTLGAGDVTMYSDLIQDEMLGKDQFSKSLVE